MKRALLQTSYFILLLYALLFAIYEYSSPSMPEQWRAFESTCFSTSVPDKPHHTFDADRQTHQTAFDSLISTSLRCLSSDANQMEESIADNVVYRKELPLGSRAEYALQVESKYDVIHHYRIWTPKHFIHLTASKKGTTSNVPKRVLDKMLLNLIYEGENIAKSRPHELEVIDWRIFFHTQGYPQLPIIMFLLGFLALSLSAGLFHFSGRLPANLRPDVMIAEEKVYLSIRARFGWKITVGAMAITDHDILIYQMKKVLLRVSREEARSSRPFYVEKRMLKYKGKELKLSIGVRQPEKWISAILG